jgi:hypothetical protein
MDIAQGGTVGSIGQPRQAQQNRKDKVHGEGLSRLYLTIWVGPASSEKRVLSLMALRQREARLVVLEVDK